MKKFIVDYRITCNNCDSHTTLFFYANNIQEAEIIAENSADDMSDDDFYYHVSSVEELY